MTARHPFAAAALGLAALLSLGSCASRLGWGVLLWSAPEGPLPAGSIVPVYIKSNIQKVYVVGVPGLKGKDKNKKIELPLWQLELFKTRGAAASRVRAMGENLSLYMIAARDGLPLRDKASNDPFKSKRVFRLREGQSVKILEKVAGEPVLTGGQALPGSWYRVLADDGTVGFVFSYAMRIFDEAKEGPPVLASAKQALSGRVDLIFSRSWRPEYFQEMLDDGRVDLDFFTLRYGAFVDAIHRQVRIEMPAASELFNYTAVSEAAGVYAFEGTPLTVKIESDTRMVCNWAAGAAEAGAAAPTDSTVEDPVAALVEGYRSAGKDGSATFVVLETEPRETIQLETLRRQKLLSSFVDEAGGAWRSPQGVEGAGDLIISKNGRFAWKRRGEAVAALLPLDAGETGEVACRLFLDPAIAASWDGSLSLRFDQAEAGKDRRAWLDFLYRRSPAGLVLAPASPLPGTLVITAAAAAGPAPLLFESAAE